MTRSKDIYIYYFLSTYMYTLYTIWWSLYYPHIANGIKLNHFIEFVDDLLAVRCFRTTIRIMSLPTWPNLENVCRTLPLMMIVWFSSVHDTPCMSSMLLYSGSMMTSSNNKCELSLWRLEWRIYSLINVSDEIDDRKIFFRYVHSSICACFFPWMVWISKQGCSQLILKRRRIVSRSDSLWTTTSVTSDWPHVTHLKEMHVVIKVCRRCPSH